MKIIEKKYVNFFLKTAYQKIRQNIKQAIE